MYMRIILIVYSNYKSIFETYNENSLYNFQQAFVFIKYFEIFSPFFPETNLEIGIKLLKFIKLSTITSLHLKQI